jgi:hypothetical protein
MEIASLERQKVMKRLFIPMLLSAACCLRAADMKTGKERLRELVVMPSINLTVTYDLHPSRADFLEDHLIPAEIDKLRHTAKEESGNPECLLRLATLLSQEGKTNEAEGFDSQAEKAARRKSELRPKDGLALASLGEGFPISAAISKRNVYIGGRLCSLRMNGNAGLIWDVPLAGNLFEDFSRTTNSRSSILWRN